MGAETRVIWVQVKGHSEPPEAGRGQEEFCPRACEGSLALLTAWFESSRLQNHDRINCADGSQPIRGALS